MNELHTFDEAVANFSAFLQQNGYPSDVIWVAEQDVLVTPARLVYVRFPTPRESAAAARRSFEMGMCGLGVRLSTICASQEASYCNAWAPMTRDQAARAMMRARAVKMFASTNNSEAIVVRSRSKWLFLRFKFRSHQRFRASLFHFD